MMVEAFSDKFPTYQIVVYSGDRDVTGEQILQKVKDRFAIDLTTKRVGFCFLKTRQWVEASRYPIFTMVGQSFGAMILVIDALTMCNPHIFFDSMGYSFTYWICRIFGGCQVGAYVHYPTISTDMLDRVKQGAQTYNNRRLIAKIPFLQHGKLIYYRLFAKLYGLSGRAAQLVFVNSSWTKAHIDALWKIPHRTQVVFPPCNCVELSKLPLGNRTPGTIISIAQFRPEKDHALQIRAIAKLLEKHAHISGVQQSKLVLIGSCRNHGDEQRIAHLKLLAEQVSL
jgi:alpha-1,2-mannosyltransferase